MGRRAICKAPGGSADIAPREGESIPGANSEDRGCVSSYEESWPRTVRDSPLPDRPPALPLWDVTQEEVCRLGSVLELFMHLEFQAPGDSVARKSEKRIV